MRVAANVGLPGKLKILADVGDLAKENQMYILEGIELQSTNVMVAHATVTHHIMYHYLYM